MQDHIKNNILPQEKEERHRANQYLEDISIAYNQALSEVHAVLPQVIEYIYADLREKIDKLEMFDIEMSLEDGLEIVERVTMTFITAKDIKDLLTPNQE